MFCILGTCPRPLSFLQCLPRQRTGKSPPLDPRPDHPRDGGREEPCRKMVRNGSVPCYRLMRHPELLHVFAAAVTRPATQAEGVANIAHHDERVQPPDCIGAQYALKTALWFASGGCRLRSTTNGSHPRYGRVVCLAPQRLPHRPEPPSMKTRRAHGRGEAALATRRRGQSL